MRESERGASGDKTVMFRRRFRFDHDNTKTWAGETMQMQNIPTDLLRTLIAVVDLRSFTKAAQMLGVTQPAVSAQIKRLQSLIGYELLDKSAPGVSLTQRGVTVVAQARRLLAINDEILQVTNGNAGRPDAARRNSRGLLRFQNSRDPRAVPPALAGRRFYCHQRYLGQHAARRSSRATSTW